MAHLWISVIFKNFLLANPLMQACEMGRSEKLILYFLWNYSSWSIPSSFFASSNLQSQKYQPDLGVYSFIRSTSCGTSKNLYPLLWFLLCIRGCLTVLLLIQQQLYLIDKDQQSLKIKIKAMKAAHDDVSFNSQYCEQYAITLQFQLQREKQKNKILQQRLRNKQIFIVQMKKMQSQMEILNQKCRIDLQQQREKRQQLESVTLREYAETIAQLEHKVNLLERNAGPQRRRNSRQDHIMTRVQAVSKSRSKRQLQEANNKQNFKQETIDLLKNFSNRFLQMFSLYNNGNDNNNMKKNLKSGWKWIKNVVKQWEQNKNLLKQIHSYVLQCKNDEQEVDLASILSLFNENEDQCEEDEA